MICDTAVDPLVTEFHIIFYVDFDPRSRFLILGCALIVCRYWLEVWTKSALCAR